jgi:hypothetical protein
MLGAIVFRQDGAQESETGRPTASPGENFLTPTVGFGEERHQLAIGGQQDIEEDREKSFVGQRAAPAVTLM